MILSGCSLEASSTILVFGVSGISAPGSVIKLKVRLTGSTKGYEVYFEIVIIKYTIFGQKFKGIQLWKIQRLF
jgi:hypothetical protein